MEKILQARENKQKNLGKCLKKDFIYIILKVNFPGEDKRTNIAQFLINLFRKRLNEVFLIKKVQKYSDFDGFYDIYEINDKNAIEVKEKCIEIEDTHKLGRYIDIDVYYNSLVSISRSSLGKEHRKCFLCDNIAHICIRNRTHSIDDLKLKIERDVVDYIFNETNVIIKESIKFECELDPKFGLVTINNSGSHADMDYSLMIDTIDAIAPYIAMMTVSGFCNSINEIYDDIREIGKLAEKNMFKVTKGINTYKGLIFGMGFAAASLGFILKSNNFSYDKLKETICTLSKRVKEDFLVSQKTFGYYAYQKYGFLGARGEVIKGLPNAFSAIKVLDRYNNYSNEALTMALIEIIIGLEDTVLLKRSGSLDKYNYYKNLVGSIENYDIVKIKEITEECVRNNISFGGAADVLAISIFIKKMCERIF